MQYRVLLYEGRKDVSLGTESLHYSRCIVKIFSFIYSNFNRNISSLTFTAIISVLKASTINILSIQLAHKFHNVIYAKVKKAVCTLAKSITIEAFHGFMSENSTEPFVRTVEYTYANFVTLNDHNISHNASIPVIILQVPYFSEK